MDAARSTELWRSTAISLWTAQGLVATVLINRRLSGEFAGSIPTPIVILWWSMSLVWSGFALWAYRLASPRLLPSSEPIGYGPECLAGVLALTAILCGTPQAEPEIIGLLTGGIVIAAGVWYGGGIAAPVLENLADPVGAGSHPSETLTPPAELSDHAASISQELALCESEDALQTMTRRQEPDAEIVEGVLRVEFHDSQRETVIHVSFCPPLASRPEVELEDLDGNAWDLKIAACYPFGLRLAVRRRSNGSTTGRIAYFASASLRRAA